MIYISSSQTFFYKSHTNKYLSLTSQSNEKIKNKYIHPLCSLSNITLITKT